MEINNAVKKTMGRRKIEIKKIQKKSKLLVTFSKRRRGLFRKASELSILCGAEVAILVQSPANKMFAFGNPSIIDRLTNYNLSSSSSRAVILQSHDACRSKYEEAERALEMEKRRMQKEKEKRVLWWENPVEGMELHELEEFLVGLEDLRENVNRKLEVEQFLNMDQNNVANGKAEVGEESLIGLDDEFFIQQNNVATGKVEADEEFWAGLIEGIM